MTVLSIGTFPKLCIISAYLPCRGSCKLVNFLDQIEEICIKFNDHAIFICGDLNASLSRNPSKERDISLTNFVVKHYLINRQKGTATFYHENREQSAELDYILKNSLVRSISGDVFVKKDQVNNVSGHLAVSTTINISIRNRQKSIMSNPRPNLETYDKKLFQNIINDNMEKVRRPMENGQITESINILKVVLDKAAEEHNPGYNPNKKRRSKSRAAITSPEVIQASKASIYAWWKWKLAGKPNSIQHPSKKDTKSAKYNLRRAQRQVLSKNRNEKMKSIMEAKGTNS